MIYQKKDIIKDVRIVLDQNRVDDSLLSGGDGDTLRLDEEIESNILKGVELAEKSAPYWMLEEGHNFQSDVDAVHWGDQASGWVRLPDDFMRLVVFEMSDWERPCNEPISTTSLQYKLQRGRVKALRGVPQRPVVAIAERPIGKVLEFYSCKNEEATIAKAVYLPYPTIDEYGGVDMAERVHDAAMYLIASLVLTTFGAGDKAKAMMETGMTLLNVES